jgi:hypothetical protein
LSNAVGEVGYRDKRLYAWGSPRAWVIENHLVGTDDLGHGQHFHDEKRRLETTAQFQRIEVGYRVLEVAGRAGVIDLQCFFCVEEVDERGYRQEQKKKNKYRLLLHL